MSLEAYVYTGNIDLHFHIQDSRGDFKHMILEYFQADLFQSLTHMEASWALSHYDDQLSESIGS